MEKSATIELAEANSLKQLQPTEDANISRPTTSEDVSSQNDPKIVDEFQYLLEKSQQLFSGLRYFARTLTL